MGSEKSNDDFLVTENEHEKDRCNWFGKMGTLHSGIINAFKDVRIVILKRVTE
jgi:hypothetical protein|tara:strand:+ start:249 stop:407 length:159 start_codon:yes stop_codon:yes gene_type:complete